jgi:short-subunit dehydrogenase
MTSSLKAYELMRKDRGGRGGTIVNMSSITALHSFHVVPVYSATRSAVLQFDMCLGVSNRRDTVLAIDLVLINEQSVGKRSHRLMDTVNAKKRWTTIYWRVKKLLKKCHIVTRLLKREHHF